MKAHYSPSIRASGARFIRGSLSLLAMAWLSALAPSVSLAQSSFTWSGLGGDLNFGTGANWQGNAAPGIGSGVTLDFTGGTQPTPYNNYGAFNDFGSWLLDNAAATNFVITGSSIGLWSKIENDSTNLFGLGISNIAARAAIQLNPVGGNLTISNSSVGGSIFLDNNQSLTVWGDNINPSRTLTLDTVLSQGNGTGGSGSLTVNQKATVVLLQNNTYGATTLNSGTVQVGNGGTSGSLGSGLVSNNVAGGSSIIFNRSDAITVANQLWASASSNATFYQNGSGSVTLAGTADNISCTPVVNAGTLILGKTSSGSVHAVGGVGTINNGGTVKLGGTGGDQLWSGAGFTVNSGGLFDMAGLSESFDTLAGAGTVTNSVGTASGLTLGENGGSPAFSGSIKDGSLSGAKITLTKAGNGTLTLGGANGYSGGTYVKAGTVAISSDGNLGASAGGLTMGAATLHATASLATSRSVTLTNASSFTVDPSTTLTLSSGLSSTAAASLSLNLNGGGTLSLKGNSVINNDSPLYANNATLEIDPGSGGTFNATNKVVLANASSSTVALNVKSGTATFGQPDFFVMADGSATANSTVNVSGGTMNLYMTSGQRIMVGLQGSAYFNVSGGTVNFGSALGNIQIGGDTQYSGNNANGTLTVSGGAVNITGSNPLLLGQNSTGKTGAKGTLNLFGGTLTTSRAVTGSSGSSYAVFSGGTLRAGANSSAFVTSLTSATVSTNGLALDSSTFTVTIGQALLHDNGLSGTDGGLLKLGSGALTLSGNNTYNGGTVLGAGTLNVSSDNNLGAATGGLTLGGGTFHDTASFATARAVTVTNNSTIQVDSVATLTVNNGVNNTAASGAAGLTVNGGGTLSLKGNVNIANDNAFTANAITVNVDPGSSGTFNAAGKFTLANASSSTATMNLLSGTANFTGSEFFAMGDGSGTANGVLNILGGTMNVNLANGLRMLLANVGTANINISGGSLVVGASTGGIELGGDIQWAQNNPSATLTLSGTGSMTVNGVGGVFELGRNSAGKTGAKGTLNLFGGALATARSITGADGASFFNFNGGTLAALANNTTFLQGLSAANVSSNGAAIDTAGYAVTIAQGLLHDTNVLGTDGGLTKLGAGDLTLSGASTYNGPTLVKAGRLFVNGTLGSNTVTVTNGASLLGAGTIGGPVVIQSGGTLQPGSTGTSTSTLSVNNNVSLGGSTVMWLDNTNAQAASRLQSTATIGFGGTLTVTNLGPALQANDLFVLFSGAAYSNSFAAIILPPLSDPSLAWDTTMLPVNGTISVATVASVTVAPDSTNAECASTITLSATAEGAAPLALQWFDNLTNAISGATNSTLTLTNITSAQAGNYTVQVVNNVGSASAIAAVTVSDTTPPVITLNGPNPMTVECHGSFSDPGATALDACAGPVAVVPSGTVDANTAGVYTLTYTANDGSGNSTNLTRTVNVVDTTAPDISWSFTNLTLSADSNCQALMPDVTGTNYVLAADACSTALTITQDPTNNAVLNLGTNEVVLAVADSSGNTAYVTNTIVVADMTAPTLLVLGDNPMTNECHAAFVDPGATASDTCSGVASLSTNSTVDPNTPGVYALTYIAQDGAGNAATNTRTVYVADTSLPVVTLNGANPMTVECHGGFVDPSATAEDACAGSLSVTVSGSVDPNTPGSYTLTYSATDPSGNTGTATRTVNVVDTTAPVISWSFTNLTLSADATCQALMPDVTGTNYILAADACSAVLTVTQTPTNNAVLALGTNEVVLAVADGSGNIAYSTNTVVVADTTAPTLTLLGANPLTNECHAAFIDPGATATDNCSGVVSLSTNNPVDAATLGVYTISYVAQDAAGNSTTNTRTVYVVDTTAPTITQCVPAQTLTADSSGHATLPDLTSLLQATDNCSASLHVSQDPPAGTSLSVGVTNVAFYVDDGNLNTNTCSASVTVNAAQLVPPTITSQQLLEDGSFQLIFSGPSGQSYKVLASPDPSLPLSGWNVLTNGTFSTNPASFSEGASAPARFYRIGSP